MDAQAVESLKQRLRIVRDRRSEVAQLLDQPNVGTLRIDVSQALEEIDELLAEASQVFSDL